MSLENSGLSALLQAQHADGGWGYASGTSWAEPTCFAIIALRAAQTGQTAVDRASEWLVGLQDRSGGLVPARGIDQATVVTSLVILSLARRKRFEGVVHAATRWLINLYGAESSPFQQLVRTLTGRRSPATDFRAWPWYPGTAAWVTPTSLTLLALRKQAKQTDPEIGNRIRNGMQFLLARRCPDHGWNHGGTARANEMPFSYPETTGIALLALTGMDDHTLSPSLSPSLDRAEALYRTAPSAEGQYWLRLALSAHGRTPPAAPRQFRDWNINGLALGLIAKSAEAGRNPFLEDLPA